MHKTGREPHAPFPVTLNKEDTMFAERLNLLIRELSLSNAILAGYTGINRSNISRLRSGKKNPGLTGKTSLYSLADGIIRHCSEHGYTEKLYQMVGAENALSSEELKESVVRWLSWDSGNLDWKAANKLRCKHFGERLSLSMQLSSLTNVMLSRLIGVSPSLISRYRLGNDMPVKNSAQGFFLTDTLWQYILRNGKTKELAGYMDLDGLPDENRYAEWLLDVEHSEQNDIQNVKKILQIFEVPLTEDALSLPSYEQISETEQIEEQESYSGADGLRRAVIRFLCTVIEKQANELYLYSDEGMDWMTSDSAFLLKWSALMGECVKRSIHIRIIHNIDRNSEEMIHAIKVWMPLYLSGMIEPYYCLTPGFNRFSHTMFLSPDIACITGFHVKGTEKHGIYHYDTSQPKLTDFYREFQELFKDAKHLMTFSKSETQEQEAQEISEDPFRNTKIMVCDEYVNITHALNPSLTFSFLHPMMCRAFQVYARYLKENGKKTG